MNWFSRQKKQVYDFLIDHPKAKVALNLSYKVFITIISSFIFAYGLRAFIVPTSDCVSYWLTGNANAQEVLANSAISDVIKSQISTPTTIISGGASGISQTFVKFLLIFSNVQAYEKYIISILYFVINIPLFILAWVKISKQFCFFTFLNVLVVSLFNAIIPDSWIYNIVNIYDDLLARCIFAGITTGLGSGLAIMIGTSSGGIDIISIYISEKKSTSVGKYSALINLVTVIFFVLFSIIGGKTHPDYNKVDTSRVVTSALYTVIYLFVSSKVIDFLNTKNVKQELQIFTSNDQVPIVLIHAFPHSCTIVESKGAYSGKKNYVVYMVISKSERRKAVKLVRMFDKYSFITVIDINQVYGKFYIKPFD